MGLNTFHGTFETRLTTPLSGLTAGAFPPPPLASASKHPRANPPVLGSPPGASHAQAGSGTILRETSPPAPTSRCGRAPLATVRSPWPTTGTSADCSPRARSKASRRVGFPVTKKTPRSTSASRWRAGGEARVLPSLAWVEGWTWCPPIGRHGDGGVCFSALRDAWQRAPTNADQRRQCRRGPRKKR